MDKDEKLFYTLSLIFGVAIASISTYGFYRYMLPSTLWEILVFVISGFVAAILMFAAGFCFGFMVLIFIKYRKDVNSE